MSRFTNFSPNLALLGLSSPARKQKVFYHLNFSSFWGNPLYFQEKQSCLISYQQLVAYCNVSCQLFQIYNQYREAIIQQRLHELPPINRQPKPIYNYSKNQLLIEVRSVTIKIYKTLEPRRNLNHNLISLPYTIFDLISVKKDQLYHLLNDFTNRLIQIIDSVIPIHTPYLLSNQLKEILKQVDDFTYRCWIQLSLYKDKFWQAPVDNFFSEVCHLVFIHSRQQNLVKVEQIKKSLETCCNYFWRFLFEEIQAKNKEFAEQGYQFFNLTLKEAGAIDKLELRKTLHNTKNYLGAKQVEAVKISLTHNLQGIKPSYYNFIRHKITDYFHFRFVQFFSSKVYDINLTKIRLDLMKVGYTNPLIQSQLAINRCNAANPRLQELKYFFTDKELAWLNNQQVNNNKPYIFFNFYHASKEVIEAMIVDSKGFIVCRKKLNETFYHYLCEFDAAARFILSPYLESYQQEYASCGASEAREARNLRDQQSQQASTGNLDNPDLASAYSTEATTPCTVETAQAVYINLHGKTIVPGLVAVNQEGIDYLNYSLCPSFNHFKQMMKDNFSFGYTSVHGKFNNYLNVLNIPWLKDFFSLQGKISDLFLGFTFAFVEGCDLNFNHMKRCAPNSLAQYIELYKLIFSQGRNFLELDQATDISCLQYILKEAYGLQPFSINEETKFIKYGELSKTTDYINHRYTPVLDSANANPSLFTGLDEIKPLQVNESTNASANDNGQTAFERKLINKFLFANSLNANYQANLRVDSFTATKPMLEINLYTSKVQERLIKELKYEPKSLKKKVLLNTNYADSAIKSLVRRFVHNQLENFDAIRNAYVSMRKLNPLDLGQRRFNYYRYCNNQSVYDIYLLFYNWMKSKLAQFPTDPFKFKNTRLEDSIRELPSYTQIFRNFQLQSIYEERKQQQEIEAFVCGYLDRFSLPISDNGEPMPITDYYAIKSKFCFRSLEQLHRLDQSRKNLRAIRQHNYSEEESYEQLKQNWLCNLMIGSHNYYLPKLDYYGVVELFNQKKTDILKIGNLLQVNNWLNKLKRFYTLKQKFRFSFNLNHTSVNLRKFGKVQEQRLISNLSQELWQQIESTPANQRGNSAHFLDSRGFGLGTSTSAISGNPNANLNKNNFIVVNARNQDVIPKVLASEANLVLNVPIITKMEQIEQQLIAPRDIDCEPIFKRYDGLAIQLKESLEEYQTSFKRSPGKSFVNFFNNKISELDRLKFVANLKPRVVNESERFSLAADCATIKLPFFYRDQLEMSIKARERMHYEYVFLYNKLIEIYDQPNLEGHYLLIDQMKYWLAQHYEVNVNLEQTYYRYQPWEYLKYLSNKFNHESGYFLDAFTANAAKALEIDHLVGDLSEGKLANFIITDSNLTKIEQTYYKGICVFNASIGQEVGE